MASDVAEIYLRDGAVIVPIVSAEQASIHRAALERCEALHGPLHYLDKIHTVMTSPFELASHSAVLDIVETLIGPDILLYNSTYIIKEPGSDTFVSWHQDLTYWGLADDDAQVSMWLALAPATVESGCMSMLPGSHKRGPMPHVQTDSDANVLLMGQQIPEVDTSHAIPYPLAAGEASFHHGWTVHASGPNRSSDRRIGLNVQYLAPHNQQVQGSAMSAILVRGSDKYGYFAADTGATSDFAPEATARWRVLDAAMKAGFKTDAGHPGQ